MVGNPYFVIFIVLIGYLSVDSVLQHHEPAVIEELRQREAPGSRIVAGWPAADGQIPHQIYLRIVTAAGGVNNCGGSIIHHEWVLTAAHCVANRYRFVVRIGLTNLTRPEYILEADRRYIHPGYHEPSGGVQTDDIALIRLNTRVSYGANIKPCRLQSSAQKNLDYTGVVMTVSGYGMVDDGWNGGISSEILNWVLLRGISNGECLWWYNNDEVIQDQTICAEYYNNTAQSACQGDSGGPLTVVDFDGQPTMVGLVSFGSTAGCNSPWPSAYVRPGHYHEWFREVTGLSFDWSLPQRLAPEDNKAAP